jgi:predicted type IV restriction endonuclease
MSSIARNNDTETFEEFLARIHNDDSLDGANEEAIRQVVVLPVLKRLGWNPGDRMEVFPEYPIELKRVDYCLKHNGHEQVLIETRRGAWH